MDWSFRSVPGEQTGRKVPGHSSTAPVRSGSHRTGRWGLSPGGHDLGEAAPWQRANPGEAWAVSGQQPTLRAGGMSASVLPGSRRHPSEHSGQEASRTSNPEESRPLRVSDRFLGGLGQRESEEVGLEALPCLGRLGSGLPSLIPPPPPPPRPPSSSRLLESPPLPLPRFILTCDFFISLRGSNTAESQIAKCYFSKRTGESLESPRNCICSITGPFARWSE